MICVRWLAVCGGLAVSSAAPAAPGEEFAGVVAGFSQLEWLAGAGLNEEPLDNNDWLLLHFLLISYHILDNLKYNLLDILDCLF